MFSIVIPSFNTRDALVACLRAIAAQSEPAGEIVVVENASTDGSAAAARAALPEARVLVQERNVGFAEACNRGISVTRGDWIVLLNSDTVPEPDWLAALRLASEELPTKIGMLQCRVVQQHAPSQLDTTGVEIGPTGEFVQRGKGLPSATHFADAPFCASACAAAYRREMLDGLALESGIFDAAFFAYFEDVDLGWRARLAGFETLEVSDARVQHAGHLSSASLGTDFRRGLAMRNRVATLLKNASYSMIARASGRLAKDLALSARHGGLSGVAAWFRSAARGFAQRSAVSRLALMSRCDLEDKSL